MQIEEVSLNVLTEDPNNAREHDERNLGAIRASLEKFGQVEPLVVRKSSGAGVVVGGNGRLAAMRLMGWKTARVTYHDLTDNQAAELGVVLNRTAELAGWDSNQLAETIGQLVDGGSTLEDLENIGFDEGELERIAVGGYTRAAPGEEEPKLEPKPPALLPDMSLENLEDRVDVLNGDCLEVLKGFDANSVDAVVTDPPAGIAFMDKAWDGDKGGRAQWVEWMTSVMAECLRVLKPGGHALVWALPRTSHWTGTAIEAAGFEVRDQVYHLFGTGFPKSLDVSRAIDKAAGVEPLGSRPATLGMASHSQWNQLIMPPPTTDEAKQWDGWGTALKPAAEVWWLARKPLEGTVADNVLAHGTGALNVDGCRVGDEFRHNPSAANAPGGEFLAPVGSGPETGGRDAIGRWPAHVVHDGDESLPEEVRRFFYCAKPSTSERDAGLDKNDHPTVKPVALMRWLCRLITPPGGIVLDPFTGSGTTGIAALQEGLSFIGIEQDESHYRKAKARIIEGARRINDQGLG